jgi:Eukaryotic cytochrome b561
MMYQRSNDRPKVTSYHIATQTAGLVMLVIGALIIYINKNIIEHGMRVPYSLTEAHFESIHSISGLLTTVTVLSASLFAYVIRSNKQTIGIDKVKRLFILHKAGGYLALAG